MCGIVGVVGNLFSKDISAFNDMLIANQVRGKASTGVVSWNENDNAGKFLKRVGGPEVLMDSKPYDDIVRTSKWLIIGHGRQPTLGRVNYNNAQPFAFDSVTGVHNGTLSWLDQDRLEGRKEYDTDSEQLYAHIDKHGVVDALSKIGSGAYSLVFHTPDNKVHFVRNDQRPMFLAFNKARTVMFFASEPRIIQWACDRRDVELDTEPAATPTMQLITFDKPTGDRVFGKPHMKEVKGFVAPQLPRSTVQDWEEAMGGMYGDYHGPSANNSSGRSVEYVGGARQSFLDKQKAIRDKWQNTGRNVIALPGPKSDDRDAIWNNNDWRPPYKDKDGVVIKKKVFDLWCKDGCCNCGTTPVWLDKVLFMGKSDTGHQLLVCETCLMDADTRDVMKLTA